MTDIIPPNPTQPIVNAIGEMSQQFRDFTQATARESVLVGDGDPEGVISAQQTRMYMDENGAAGSILYIKQKASISGDDRLGWVAIG